MAVARRLLNRHRFLVLLVALLAIAGAGRLVSQSTQVASQPTQDDLPRYSFTVAIEGRQVGTFREVSGLDVEIEVVEFREGTGGAIRYLPGLTKYAPIKLTRAFTGNTELSDWFTAFLQSRTERVNGSITMLDQTGQVVAAWTFAQGWPSKISGPTLSGEGNEVATESLTIVHEGLVRVRPR